MRIQIDFLNGSPYCRYLVRENADKAADIISSQWILTKIATWPGFDDTGLTPAQVAKTFANADEVSIKVGFYWNPFGLAIAKEANGLVRFNTAKESFGAGSPGNVAHEVSHALGFQHNGNRPGGNENTVPWRIGQWVDEVANEKN